MLHQALALLENDDFDMDELATPASGQCDPWVGRGWGGGGLCVKLKLLYICYTRLCSRLII